VLVHKLSTAGRNSNVREVTRDKLYEANPNMNPARVR
jgi:hypothetical protein